MPKYAAVFRTSASFKIALIICILREWRNKQKTLPNILLDRVFCFQKKFTRGL